MRAKFLDAAWLAENLPEAWSSNKNTVLDKAIMHKCPNLDWWLRPYMEHEIRNEHDDMLLANMTAEQILESSDEFLEMHKGSTARLVVVIDRETGVRLKNPMFITLGHANYTLLIDSNFAMQVDKFHKAIEETKQSKKKH
jgi:hypothetical protein